MKSELRGTFLAALCVSTAIIAPTCAIAQTADPQTGRAEAARAGSLDEIIVTAQRRSQNLQDVPIAVSAFTGEMLERRGILSSVGLETATPGLVMTRQTAGSTPFLRGVGSPTATTGVESPVATYIDGVYYISSVGNVLSFNNVERVEVLKGPQGTLFGRNATGGLISITTRDPSVEPSIKARIGYGNYNTIEGSLYATGGSGNLAADLAVYGIRQSDGYGRNLTTGAQVDRERNISLRSKIQWRPGDDDKLTLALDWSRDRGDMGLNYNAVPGSLFFDGQSQVGKPHDTRGEFASGMKLTAWGASLRYEHQFDFGSFTSTTAYRSLTSNYSSDIDGTALAFLAYLNRPRTRTLQQELLLVGKSGRLDWTVGVFLFDAVEQSKPLDIFTQFIPVYNQSQFGRQDTRSYAGFAQGTYALTDSTNLTAGIRYTIDDRSFNGRVVARANNSSPIGTILTQASADRTFKKPSWRLGIDQKLNDDVMIYATYNRGFKSGLFNTNDIGAPAIEPETLDSYELGIKSELFDKIVRLNVAGFHYNYKNIQLSKIVSGNQALLNAASARVNGAELELSISPPVTFGELRFDVAGSYLDGKYRSFKDGPLTIPTGAGGNAISSADFDGFRMIRAPKFTVSLSATVIIPVGSGSIGATGSFYHNSGFFWEPDHRLRQTGYDVVNAQLYYAFGDDKQFRVVLWGKNLTDATYANLQYSGALGDFAAYTAPRTYGVALEFGF